MMKRPARIVLFLAAAVLGGAVAWWLMPHWNDGRALDRITSDDHSIRDRGWHWLRSVRPDDPVPRAARVIDRINAALIDASDDALLHAGEVLRPMDLWAWNTQPIDLTLRELTLRAESHTGDQQLAAVELLDCPFDAPEEQVINLAQRLIESADPDVRMLAMRGIVAWTGIERAELLRLLDVPDDDYRLERLRRLAMSWRGVPADDQFLDAQHDALPIDVLEAALLQSVRADPEDASTLIEIVRRWQTEPKPAFAYLLRHSHDPAAERELDRLADRGIDAARFALHARDPQRDAARAEEIARDQREPMWRRRLAAWRMPRIDRALLDELLAAPVSDADRSVYAIALLAERHHEQDALTDLADHWMRDLDNDRKRAGALLAALIGEHGELLDQLARLPDDAHVRTTARLASTAVRHEVNHDELIELGYRTLRKPDGDFDADMLLAMLAAGYADLLAMLVDPPRGEWRMAIQQRAMLIERFVPHWHEAAGRPISGDNRTILLHFDWLRARRLLESRRMEFDATRRVYHASEKASGTGH